MTDRTGVAATIHACPPLRVREVLDQFEIYGLTVETEDDASSERATLVLQEAYSGVEVPCGSAAEFTNELMKRAPEVAFTVFEAPAYSSVGSVFMHVPELGVYEAACDESGVPLLSQEFVLEQEGKPEEVRQKELGVPWLAAIAALAGGVVTEPEWFVSFWSRRGGEVLVDGGGWNGTNVRLAVSEQEVNVILSEAGYQRFEEWTQVDDSVDLWCARVYRVAVAG